jgi:hypothetical protein
LSAIGIEFQFSRLGFDLIERRKVPQALFGDFASMIGIKIACVGHAARFDDTALS